MLLVSPARRYPAAGFWRPLALNRNAFVITDAELRLIASATSSATP